MDNNLVQLVNQSTPLPNPVLSLVYPSKGKSYNFVNDYNKEISGMANLSANG